MADRPLAELHWFPFYVKDFTASPSVQRMDDAEVGRYLRLLCLAFGNGLREPSLEKDDLNTASARVKTMFFERDGRLYNETLSQVWRESQARHAQAVKRGKASGAARRKGKRLETVSEPSRVAKSNGGEQGAMDVVVREVKDSLTRGAGAVPDGGPAPTPREQENGAHDVRQPSGKPSLIGSVIASMGLTPRRA